MYQKHLSYITQPHRALRLVFYSKNAVQTILNLFISIQYLLRNTFRRVRHAPNMFVCHHTCLFVATSPLLLHSHLYPVPPPTPQHLPHSRWLPKPGPTPVWVRSMPPPTHANGRLQTRTNNRPNRHGAWRTTPMMMTVMTKSRRRVRRR